MTIYAINNEFCVQLYAMGGIGDDLSSFFGCKPGRAWQTGFEEFIRIFFTLSCGLLIKINKFRGHHKGNFRPQKTFKPRFDPRKLLRKYNLAERFMWVKQVHM